MLLPADRRNQVTPEVEKLIEELKSVKPQDRKKVSSVTRAWDGRHCYAHCSQQCSVDDVITIQTFHS